MRIHGQGRENTRFPKAFGKKGSGTCIKNND
jgi:hypothetical protein